MVVVVCRLEVDLLLTDLATRVVCAFAREFLRVSVINLSIYEMMGIARGVHCRRMMISN